MKRFLIVLIVGAVALSSTACFHNQIITSPDYDPNFEEADHEELRMHLAGFVPLGGNIDLSEACPDSEAGVVEARQFFGAFAIEFGQARVHCTPAGAELDQEDLEEKFADADGDVAVIE